MRRQENTFEKKREKDSRTTATRQQKTDKNRQNYINDHTFPGQTSTEIVIQVKRICDVNREERENTIKASNHTQVILIQKTK